MNKMKPFQSQKVSIGPFIKVSSFIVHSSSLNVLSILDEHLKDSLLKSKEYFCQLQMKVKLSWTLKLPNKLFETVDDR